MTFPIYWKAHSAAKRIDSAVVPLSRSLVFNCAYFMRPATTAKLTGRDLNLDELLEAILKAQHVEIPRR